MFLLKYSRSKNNTHRCVADLTEGVQWRARVRSSRREPKDAEPHALGNPPTLKGIICTRQNIQDEQHNEKNNTCSKIKASKFSAASRTLIDTGFSSFSSFILSDSPGFPTRRANK